MGNTKKMPTISTVKASSGIALMNSAMNQKASTTSSNAPAMYIIMCNTCFIIADLKDKKKRRVRSKYLKAIKQEDRPYRCKAQPLIR